ncbi:hypothetical protein V8J88_01995 [Massilia sp. W12]|uniref:hypothetical protein n=1 Tax=Massilia sp. W12 TaxID=3126507 RepID=UPI0030D47CA0
MQFVDPYDLVDLNLFHPIVDKENHSRAEAWNPTWAYVVAGHGNPVNMTDENQRIIYPWDLAKRIRSDPKWKGRPVIVASCNTGREPSTYPGRPSFQQYLADELGVDVTSATDFVFFQKNGKPPLVGPIDGPPTNSWKSVSPRRTK